jgi:hypothetical protein
MEAIDCEEEAREVIPSYLRNSSAHLFFVHPIFPCPSSFFALGPSFISMVSDRRRFP